MDPRRILLSSKSSTLGGVELRVGLEARFLKKEGYSPAVAINMHRGLYDWRNDLVREDIPVFDFDPAPFMERWRWRTINKLRAKWFSARFLRRYRPDLIHVFLPWTTFGGTRIWLAHHCGIPAVLSVRNSFRGGPEIWSPWHVQHYAESFQSVKGIYAISPSALKHFLNIFGQFLMPKTVTEVISNGVDTELFRPGNDVRAEARKTLGLPEEALVFGTVGRLDIQKRPKALLSLFVELKRSFPDLYLVLVGSGLLEDEIRRQVKSLGLIDSVVFVGFSKRVEKVLPALDLFVILSSVEGFGTATVEAMACGLPVVGTDVPGTRDILMDSKAGTLVPLDDQEATVKACAQYLENHQLRKTVGREARQEAVKKYDIREWEKRILEFYAKVLSRPNGSLN